MPTDAKFVQIACGPIQYDQLWIYALDDESALKIIDGKIEREES